MPVNEPKAFGPVTVEEVGPEGQKVYRLQVPSRFNDYEETHLYLNWPNNPVMALFQGDAIIEAVLYLQARSGATPEPRGE